MTRHIVALGMAGFALFSAGCRPASAFRSAPAVADSALLGQDVRFLASDALEGRRTGTAGNDSAAAYIARRLAVLGIERVVTNPAGCGRGNGNGGGNGGACAPGFLQPFVARPAAAGRAGLPSELPSNNVTGIIRGTDPALRGQYVILGAHFDHLGRSTFGALDPNAGDEIRNGADDNASGTSTVLELARLLSRNPPKRSVLVAFFTGEEFGLLGSQYFVENLPVPRDSVQAMLNFDMVGRLKNDRVIVYGVATATELPAIVNAANVNAANVNAANVAPPLQISAVGDGFGPSDHASFYGKNLPVLHFFTDLHEDYHRATDDAEKINLAGMTRIVSFAERITRDLADRPGRLTFVRAPAAAAPQSGSRQQTQVYLGSIPDMGANDVVGLRLSGVRAGSPADSAGLKEGDVIVEMGGTEVKDLYTYSDALYRRQPGETITIVYLRAGERRTTQVTLGRRPG